MIVGKMKINFSIYLYLLFRFLSLTYDEEIKTNPYFFPIFFGKFT